jgi:chromosome segregation protein
LLKLKRIQIQGFKSFADKMELLFEGSGITGIVGPNGCGKSNLSDAVAWVLGEQSAKSLRGGRMEDVIFNGTRSRLPLGMAEVTLTLVDPEVQRESNLGLASPTEAAALTKEGDFEGDPFDFEESSAEPGEENVDVVAGSAGPATTALATKRKRRPKFQPKPGELVVSRRLFRSGDSEYLLNGKQVRLRDIQDIFLGTGLGPDSYAIIEQGRVGMILSSKPSDRRSIIEEAAGITKFKSKRKLAESKLEQAKQNLLRVNDITEEVSKQLGSLKRQAAKARRYGELRERMRHLSKNLFNARLAILNGLLGHNWQHLETVNEQYRQKHQHIEEQQGCYRETHTSIFNQENQLKGMREQLSQLNLETDRAQQRIHFQKEQLKELESRTLENSREIERLVQQEAQYQRETDQKRQALSEASGQFERIQQDFLSQNSSFQAIQTQLQELESSNEGHRIQLLECVSRAATLRNQLQQLDDLNLRLEHQLKRLYQEKEETATIRLRLTEEQQVSERQQLEQERRLSLLKQEISSVSATSSDLKTEASIIRNQLTESKDQCSAATHRLKSLEELAAHHAYTTEAVRVLLSAATESHANSLASPGILADLIEVAGPYESVVEEFLKQELEFLLVETDANATAGISLLREKNAGRSTFLLFGNNQLPSSDGPSAAVDEALQYDASLIPLKGLLQISGDYATAVEKALPQLACSIRPAFPAADLPFTGRRSGSRPSDFRRR